MCKSIRSSIRVLSLVLTGGLKESCAFVQLTAKYDCISSTCCFYVCCSEMFWNTWLSSRRTHVVSVGFHYIIIINNKLVNMSRQCKQSGQLGAAVVKQNTAVLLSTWAYEHNIAKSCLRHAWWTQISRWLRISHTSGQKENYSGCTEAHSFIHSFLIFIIILVLIFILLFYTLHLTFFWHITRHITRFFRLLYSVFCVLCQFFFFFFLQIKANRVKTGVTLKWKGCIWFYFPAIIFCIIWPVFAHFSHHKGLWYLLPPCVGIYLWLLMIN